MVGQLGIRLYIRWLKVPFYANLLVRSCLSLMVVVAMVVFMFFVTVVVVVVVVVVAKHSEPFVYFLSFRDIWRA